jgi:hypothetical protein
MLGHGHVCNADAVKVILHPIAVVIVQVIVFIFELTVIV